MLNSNTKKLGKDLYIILRVRIFSDLQNIEFNPYSTKWEHGTKFERIDVNIHNVVRFVI